MAKKLVLQMLGIKGGAGDLLKTTDIIAEVYGEDATHDIQVRALEQMEQLGWNADGQTGKWEGEKGLRELWEKDLRTSLRCLTH